MVCYEKFKIKIILTMNQMNQSKSDIILITINYRL